MKIDTSVIRKELAAASIPTALSRPDVFLSTGNYALNYTISGNFRVAIPNRRQMMLCGPSGSGKSYLAMLLAKQAQDAGYFVVVIDTERALDEPYLNKIGMNLGEDYFMPLQVATLEDCAKAVSVVFQNTSPEDKVCLVIDSLGNLDTTDALAQFDKSGILKNDMGLKAKKTKQLIRDINVHSGERNMFVVVCNHVYENQDMMNGKGKYRVSGGESIQFIPSITLMADKKKLKNEADKEAAIRGIIMKIEVIKTRFFRLGGKTEIEVPFDTGMDLLSGFLDLVVGEGLVEQKGAWYNYTTADGKIQKFQSKDLEKHVDAMLASFDSRSTEITEQEEPNVQG